MPRPIDGDALVAKLDDWRGDIEDVDEKDAHDVAYYSAMSRALRFAKDAPILDYEPVRHGEWESVTCEGYYIPNIFEKTKREFPVCSECHKQNSIDAWTKPFYYCPYCGAKMGAKEDAHG